jgi:hypothetical protein
VPSLVRLAAKVSRMAKAARRAGAGKLTICPPCSSGRSR